MVSGRWRMAGLALLLMTVAWLASVGLGRMRAADDDDQRKGKRPPAAVPVRVAQVVRQDVPFTLQAVGQVQSPHEVIVRPQVEGIVTELRFKEGQRVQRGQVLARLDDRTWRAQLAQAEAELARLQAQLKLARLDLGRYEGLAAQAAVSSQQRDQQAGLVDELQAQARAQEAALTAARVQLSHAVITSPVTGRAGLRQVDVGNLVGPSLAQGLVTVVQTQPMGVVFAVPQTRLAEVRQALQAGRRAPVTLRDQERGDTLAQGELATVDNRIDPATGTLKLKAQVPNADERLWHGQFVTVTLGTGELAQGLVLPAAALQRGLKGTFVWRVREGRAEMVPVQVRWQDDQRAVVAAGVAPGEAVVVEGQARLKPRAAVQVLPAQPGATAGQAQG